MKVFELAKKNGYDSKDVLNGLKEIGIPVKTPVSVIPEADLVKAETLFPPPVAPKERVRDVVLPTPAPHVDAPQVTQIKVREIPTVAAEGLEPRFNQYVMGIRRRKGEGNKKEYSVLTVAFDADTLEFRLLKEEPKKTEAEAVLELKAGMVKRKVV